MLSGRNWLRGSAACSRKGGPSVSGKNIIRENASVNAFLAGLNKSRVEKLIVWNTYYQVKMKCIGAGKVSANEREKSLLTGEGHFCIRV